MKFLLLNLLAAAIMLAMFILVRRLPSSTRNKMKSLFILFALVAIVSCKKSVDAPAEPPAKASVKFYSTNMVTATKVITVKVSGQDYGRVNYSANMPACGASGFASMSLAPGNYKADYLDPANPNANKQVSFTVAAGTSTCQFFDLK